MERTLGATAASGAKGEAGAKPRDGRFAEVGVHDPVGTPVDVSVKGWKV